MFKHRLPRITLVIILGSVFVALAYAHFVVTAQEDSRIRYGEARNGSVTEKGDQQRWSFEGKAEDVMTVHVSRTSGDLIPAVSLSDPKGTLLIGLDWPADGPALSQFTVTLRSTGVHTLIIGGSAQTTGDYTLNLELLTAGIAETVDNTINYGQTSTGSISDAVFRQYWSFRGSRDDVVDITMVARSGDLDSFLSLITPDGDVIATTTDGGDGLDAALYSIQLPSSGTYSIVARRAGNDFGETSSTQGTYDLTLSLRAPGHAEDQPAPASLTLGTTLRGQLTSDSPSALYRVEASGILSLSLEAADTFQTETVSVMTPDHALLGVLSGISPLRGSVTLPGQGTVLVEVTAQNIRDNAPLDFALNVDQIKTAKSVSHPLQYGQPQTAAAFATSSADAWHFGAEAGDLVTLSIQPNDLVIDGRLEVRGPNGASLFSQPLRNGFRQSLILNSTGIYELFVDPGAVNVGYRIAVDLNGIAGVAFAQHVIPEERGVLQSGAIAPGDLASTRSDAWTFEIDEAQLWDFYLTNSVPDSPVALAIEAPDGRMLKMGLTSKLSGRLLLEVELPGPGRYRAVVYDPAGVNSQTYELSAATAAGGALSSRAPAKGVLTAGMQANRWIINVPSHSILSVRIDPVNGSTIPRVSVIGPDGLLTASTFSDENNLVGIPVSMGGMVQVIVNRPGNTPYLAYRIEADIDQPFTPEAAWNGGNGPSPEAFTTAAPTASTQRVLLSQVITPSVNLHSDSSLSAPLLGLEKLVRGQIEQNKPYGIWSFQALSAQSLALSVTSIDEKTEPVVQIVNQNGIVVAQNRASGTTSSYLMHRFPVGGTYYAVIHLPPGTRYTLWLEGISGIDETLPTVVEGHAIQYGDTISGELVRPGETSSYAFYGHNDDVIYVRLDRTRGDAPVHVALRDLNGQVLAETDLATDSWSATFSDIQLAEDQVYQVTVSSTDSDGDRFVQYALHVDLQSGSAYSDHDGGVILGEVVSSLGGEIGDQYWLFDAQAEEQVTVILEPLTAGSPTPLSLALADTGGHIFLSKQADLGHGALRLPDVLLPRTGIYQIIISGGQQVPGLYRLQIERDKKRINGDAGVLRYGETVGEVLTSENYLDIWTFAGSQGDVVNISARAVRGDLASLSFQVRSGDGQVLATVADDGSGTGAHVENLILPADEHYSIAVGSIDGLFQGQTTYELTAYLIDTTARSMGTVIEYGQLAEGTFYTDDSADTWLFEGQQGDVVTITADGENPLLLPSISLASTDWHKASTTLQVDTLAAVQASEDNPALIDHFVLPATGTYAITIQDSTSAGGTYHLSLTGETAFIPIIGSLAENRAQIGQISSANLLDVWTFTGAKDSLLNITVASDSRSGLAPAFSVTAPDGTTIASAGAEPKGVATLQSLRLKLNGLYTVQVTRSLGIGGRTNGQYSIEMQVTTPNNAGQPTEYDRLERSMLDAETPAEQWTFVGQAGDVARIRVDTTSGDLDPVVRVFSPDGVLLAGADDVDGLDAEVTIQLAVDGIYTVEAARYGGFSGVTSGNYSLVVTRVYHQEVVNAVPMIAYGDRVTGVADQAAPDNDWFFMGEAGDVISAKIQFPLDDAPLILTFQDPVGSTLASGTRNQGDVVLEGFVLPIGGVYSLKVHRPADTRAQDYSPYALDLQLLDFASDTVPSQGGVLSQNQAVLGSFVEAPASHSWIFVGYAGQNIELLLTSLEGLSTVGFSLVAPDGTVLHETTAVNGNLSTGSIQLPLTGTYTVQISGDEFSAGQHLPPEAPAR